MNEHFEVLYKDENEEIYCYYDKEPILFGEKYILTGEGKTYKFENWLIMNQNTENYDEEVGY